MANNTNDNETETSWSINKQIPLSLILVVIMQTGGALWAVAQLNNDVRNLQGSVFRLEKQIEGQNEKYERFGVLFYSRDEANREFARVEGKLRDTEDRQKIELKELEERVKYLERDSVRTH